MGFDADLLRQEATTQGASTGEARLAELTGQGTLQVWRGEKDDVIRVLGTLRAPGDASGIDELRGALENQQAVTYEGVLDDPAQTDQRRVRTDVIVSSIGSYRLGNNEEQRVFVNFVPTKPEEVTGS